MTVKKTETTNVTKTDISIEEHEKLLAQTRIQVKKEMEMEALARAKEAKAEALGSKVRETIVLPAKKNVKCAGIKIERY